MRRKVLLFGDIGIDDTVALVYAHLNQNIELVGIVADYGNVSKAMTINNARFILDQLNRLDIKVIGGAEVPMSALTPSYYTDVHGTYGLGPLQPSSFNHQSLENFFEVIDLIKQYDHNELIIVNTGRLTSLATLLLLYPEFLQMVHSYFIMGGAFLVPGNVTPVAEANFYGDPVAANLIMKYAHNVSLFPLNVTMKAIVTPEMVNYIHEKEKATLVKPLLDFYYEEYYQKLYPEIGGSPVHDVLAFIGISNKDLFTFYKTPIAVSTTNITLGQSIGDFRSLTEKEDFDDRPSQNIAMDMNYEGFFYDFMTVMTGEEFS
ncbi:nucleoside hydrolase [Bacillus spongiae]|uniref:Nucleoside hydrolase n=1 Tax=Bacillus spongiae TaxID=2683610 RepID=A0ABU8HFJ6_9BACI